MRPRYTCISEHKHIIQNKMKNPNQMHSGRHVLPPKLLPSQHHTTLIYIHIQIQSIINYNCFWSITNSPSGGKVETKSKLMRQVGDAVDLTTFDYQSGRHQLGISSSASNQFQQRIGGPLRRPLTDQTVPLQLPSSPTPSPSSSVKQHQFEFRSTNIFEQ